MSRWLGARTAWLAASAIGSACSLIAPGEEQYFPPASNEDAGPGSGGSSAAPSSGGSAGFPSGGGSGVGGAALDGGSGTGGSGGSGGVGGASGTGGSGGVGANGGVGGNGGTGGAPCGSAQKLCNGSCVAIDDPQYGCGATTCAPCQLPFAAQTACQGSACAILSCQSTHDDCNGQAGDGCETRIVYNGNACGSCSEQCSSGKSCNDKTCTPSSCGASKGVIGPSPPTGDVSVGVWAKVPSVGGFFDKLDEPSPDDLVSYIWDDTAPESTIWFQGPSATLPAGASITSVRLRSYARVRDPGDSATITFLARVGGSTWTSSSTPLSAFYFAQLPATISTAISASSSSLVEVGIESKRSAQGNELEVTQLVIEYCVD